MDERSGHHPAWKGVPLKKRRLSTVTMGFLLMGLVVVKIIMVGIFLDLGPFHLSTASVALAENEVTSDPTPPIGDSNAKPSRENLEKKVQELKAKEMELQKREQELLPLKNEIEEKLAELNELQLRLTAYAKQLADREKTLEDEKTGHLVELYSAMEPAQAATIMDKLQVPTVVLILRNMKGKSAGKILAVMNPERGALISEKLTQSE